MAARPVATSPECLPCGCRRASHRLKCPELTGCRPGDSLVTGLVLPGCWCGLFTRAPLVLLQTPGAGGHWLTSPWSKGTLANVCAVSLGSVLLPNATDPVSRFLGLPSHRTAGWA